MLTHANTGIYRWPTKYYKISITRFQRIVLILNNSSFGSYTSLLRREIWQNIFDYVLSCHDSAKWASSFALAVPRFQNDSKLWHYSQETCYLNFVIFCIRFCFISASKRHSHKLPKLEWIILNWIFVIFLCEADSSNFRNLTNKGFVGFGSLPNSLQKQAKGNGYGRSQVGDR